MQTYLLDRFGVSDEFYHELTQVYPSLQCSYVVKEVRKKLNSKVDIVRVENGAYRPIKDTLSSFLAHIVTSLLLPSEELSYSLLESLTYIISEINSLLKEPLLNGKRLRVVFGGDYKFLLLSMGMNAAHSTYACLWCSVPSSERWDMSVDERVHREEGPDITGNAETICTIILIVCSTLGVCAFSSDQYSPQLCGA